VIGLIVRRTCSKCRAAIRLLEERGVEHRVREYTEEPLTEEEIRDVLAKLGARPKELLRTHDPAYREHGLTGDEPDGRLIELMAAHPGLVQRPIGIRGDRAVVGRPPERLLELVE